MYRWKLGWALIHIIFICGLTLGVRRLIKQAISLALWSWKENGEINQGTDQNWTVGTESKFPPWLRLFLQKHLLSIYYESNNEKMKEENSYGYVQSFINFVNRNQILKILQIYVAHAVKHAIMTINCNRGSGISPFTSKTMVKAPPEIHSHVVCNHRSHANICSNFRLGALHFCYNPNFPTFSLTPTAPYSTSHLKASVQPAPQLKWAQFPWLSISFTHRKSSD